MLPLLAEVHSGRWQFSPAAGAFDQAIVKSADWVEMAEAVFGGSRLMTNEERTALDEFTWAELRS